MVERLKLFFRADPWMVKWLEKLTRKSRLPLSHHLREAVIAYFEKIEGKPPPEIAEDEK